MEIDVEKEMNDNKAEKKERDFEKDREKILSKVAEFSSENIHARVALIMNNFPHTRDSDIDLQIQYWQVFQKDLFDGEMIRITDYPKLERQRTIARARAFVQNTLGLFQASPKVKEQRGKLEIEEKEKLKKDRPDYPAITVYADESGKNDKHLIVGSVWFLDEFSANELIKDIFYWKQNSGIKSEFHFKHINEKNINYYKQFADILLAKSSSIGLRAITVDRAGISNTQDAFIRLYAQLLLKGIKFEERTGRAVLPRYIQFVKDKEEVGFDKLLLAEIGERLQVYSQTHFQNKLYIDQLTAEDSAQHPFLQVADLFASSINRVYNKPGGDIVSAKDHFADYFLNAFGVTVNLTEIKTDSDFSYHISL